MREYDHYTRLAPSIGDSWLTLSTGLVCTAKKLNRNSRISFAEAGYKIRISNRLVNRQEETI